MKKKSYLFLLCIISALNFSGCHKLSSISTAISEQAKATASKEAAEPESENTTAETVEDEQTTNAPDDETTTEKTTPKKNPETLTGFGGDYVDLEKRCFMVNGKMYQLGVNTLQDLIDDGVPFEADALANATNNLNANSESMGFQISLGEYAHAQVSVTNTSDGNMKASDCKLSSIYLPLDEDMDQSMIQFAFPLTLTEEELIAAAGEPTDRNDYKSDDSDYESHELEYKQESKNYYMDTGYDFEFVNGALKYVTIDWIE